MSIPIQIGQMTVGGGAAIAVQSMLNVRSSDIDGNVSQAVRLERAGCEILRVAVPDGAALRLIPAIKEAIQIPLVADIHFDYRLAIESVAMGADKIRINPGNIGGEAHIKEVVKACKLNNIPIRVGVNSGSVEKDLLKKYQGPTPEALEESAKRSIESIQKYDYDRIVLSIKASDLNTMIKACRLASVWCVYPLHLGVTEAGTFHMGLIKSAVGIGSLLCDGIGDTIRVSLTGDPEPEIAAGYDILRACGVRKSGIEIISCPTCGRTGIDLLPIIEEVEEKTAHLKKPLRVAIMGCAVNGPGEAKNADLGIAGGKDEAVLFRKGEIVRKVQGDIARQLVEEIEKY